ncbi:MAG: STAS domain-containing protein [Planctomycetes bacterium]|nr:STAS domain-containing protein [Planctomycetota bacterium]
MIASKRTGTIDTLECDVPLTRDNDSAFRSCWQQLVTTRSVRIVLDMRSIPLMDSAGLESLLDMKERCEEIGATVVLARPNLLCQDILRINGLNRDFQIYDDYVEALGSFSK